MKDLIEALTILSKYANDSSRPTHCEHDVFYVAGVGIAKDAVSADDAERLEKLGFRWSTESECWASFRFGSC